MLMKKDYGYIPPTIKPEDWITGCGELGALGAVVLQPDGQWDEFLPTIDEEQNQNGFETDCCTNFGTIHGLQILLKRVFGDSTDRSKRFSAITSGTDPDAGGNSPDVVANVLRNLGVCYESDLPFDLSVLTIQQFFSPKPMTRDLKNKAITEFLNVYKFNHEWLSDGSLITSDQLKNALTFSPIGISVYAWELGPNGYYVRNGADCHWVVCYGYEDGKYWKIYDSYEGNLKQLDWNFGFTTAQRYFISRNTNPEQITLIKQLINLYYQLISAIQSLGNKLGGTSPSNPGIFVKLGIWFFNWMFPKDAPVEPKIPEPSNIPAPQPIAPPSPEKPPIPTPIVPKVSHAYGDYPEDGKMALRLMACQKCLAAGFDYNKMVNFFATIEGESGWNPACENINKDGTGDYGLCQLNSYWYLPPNKMTPQEAEDNPGKCLDIMVNAWKAGRMNDWIAFKGGGYKSRIPKVQNYLPQLIQTASKLT